MKVAVIGLGYWGPKLVRDLLALEQDVVIFDRIPERVDAVKRQYPASIPVTSIEDIWRDDSISAVFLAIQLPEHFKLLIFSLNAGKHVFVEKPLCNCIDEVDEIRHHLYEQILMVGHVTYFSLGIQKLKHLIHAGAIGKLCNISFFRTHMGPLYKGSDVLSEVAAHDIAIMLLLIPSFPQSLSAWGVSQLGLCEPDLAHLVFSWSNNLLAHIDVQWTSILRQRQIVAEGTAGTLVFRADTKTEHLTYHNLKETFAALKQGMTLDEVRKLSKSNEIPLEHCEPLREELKIFLECIENNIKPEIDLEFGGIVVKLLELARHSMWNRGERIVIP